MKPSNSTALNGICPYFTMFPLSFPLSILSCSATTEGWTLDPFCGRGTTNYASRLLGLSSIGIDSSPVATSIAQAKVVNASPQSILRVATRLLAEVGVPNEVPKGEFWDWAFAPDVLRTICQMREGLLRSCRSDARRALRGLLLGALHGPRPKSRPTYFSNQSPRTYAPKPRYAVKYWKDRHLFPESVDVMGIIEERAWRYYGNERTSGLGRVIQADSRDRSVYRRLGRAHRFNWVITSPPYYGMRTYLPDQWLRSWFLGGPPRVEYAQNGQMEHASPQLFSLQLREVWENVGSVCQPGAQLVVRFGGINDRKADPLQIIMTSLQGTGWTVRRCDPAGSASHGRRQALHFAHCKSRAIEEHDVWADWKS